MTPAGSNRGEGDLKMPNNTFKDMCALYRKVKCIFILFFMHHH